MKNFIKKIYKLILIKCYWHMPNYPESYILYRIFEPFRQFIYKQLFSFVGNSVYIRNKCYISGWKNIILNNNILIGPNSIINAQLAKIYIGDNVLIGPQLIIYTAEHGHNIDSKIPFYNQDIYSRNVYIGSNVYIGARVTILKGVKIGNNVVIAAGSIITKDIPDNEMWGGNPARQIKILKSI